LPPLADVTICLGDTANIGLPAIIENANFTWMPSKNLTDPLNFITGAYPDTTTIYTLKVMDASGCSASGSAKVTVLPKYKGSLSFEKLVLKGTKVTLDVGFNSDFYKYEWQPSDLLSCSNCKNPIYVADTSATFTLKLYDEMGCAEYNITYKIRVIPDKVDIPNVFTPNGDNKNDFFNVLVPGGSIDDIGVNRFEIYNRWGQKLNITFDKKTGWDGRHDGVICPSDVYVYVIELSFLTGDIRKYRGDITLVR
jgi:gliding motility-associated-like protein